jgi:hypothetical protein
MRTGFKWDLITDQLVFISGFDLTTVRNEYIIALLLAQQCCAHAAFSSS